LTFGTVVLSLLVALFSVLTVGAPIIMDTFTPSRPVIDVQILEQAGDVSYNLLISNGGKEAALIQSVKAPTIYAGGEDEPQSYRPTTGWPLVVEPQSFKIMQVKLYGFNKYGKMDVEKTKARYGCQLWIGFRDLHGRTERSTVSCRWPY
jgi:hypothetical protein